jgi:protein EFR3
MHIENLSLASLNQGKRGVGVTDLREALSGRASMSNAALSARAPSVMTGDRVSSILPEIALRPVKSRTDKKRLAGGPTEVRDVLSRLGIGSRPSATGSSLLRNASLSTPKQSA